MVAAEKEQHRWCSPHEVSTSATALHISRNLPSRFAAESDAQPSSTSSPQLHEDDVVDWSPEAELSVPHLSPLLDIWPPEHEQLFWKSTTWLQAMRNIDVCYAGFVVLNSMTLVKYQNRWPQSALPYHQACSWIYVLLAVIQSAYGAFPDERYYRLRPYLVGASRYMRFFQMLVTMHTMRACLTAGPCVTFLDQQILIPTVPPTLRSVRLLFLSTFTFHSLLHTTYLRYSIRGQLLFQLAYLIFIFLYMSIPAAYVLSHPTLLPSTASLCSSLDFAANLILAQVSGTAPPSSPLCTSPAAPWLLALFTQSFFATFIPSFLSYSLERRLKLKYLSQELQRRRPCSASWAETIVTVLGHCTVLLAYACICWHLVCTYHRQLLRWAVPLEWPKPLAWYQEVLHGSAQAA